MLAFFLTVCLTLSLVSSSVRMHLWPTWGDLPKPVPQVCFALLLFAAMLYGRGSLFIAGVFACLFYMWWTEVVLRYINEPFDALTAACWVFLPGTLLGAPFGLLGAGCGAAAVLVWATGTRLEQLCAHRLALDSPARPYWVATGLPQVVAVSAAVLGLLAAGTAINGTISTTLSGLGRLEPWLRGSSL